MQPDIWLIPCGEDRYECIDVCADDLLITSKDPKGMIDVLTNKNCFKHKGAGPILCHLVCDFGRDDNGTLDFGPNSALGKCLIVITTFFALNLSSTYHHL